MVAWLIGFATPGAPAGIGIRELVLIQMLGSTIVETELILAVLVGRLVTAMGDILYFTIAAVLYAKYHTREESKG